MSGSKMNRSAASLILLLLGTQPLFADEPADESISTLPDLELLEFLGSWQTPDGDFLDPLVLAGETTPREKPMEHDDD